MTITPAVFVGGPAHGSQMELPSVPSTYYVPVSPDPVAWFAKVDGDPQRPLRFTQAVYRLSGITGDGLHVYVYDTTNTNG